jgi:hypothetical protein
MILAFKTHHPDVPHHPTLFKEKILVAVGRSGRNLIPKIHTFRVGNRWAAGTTIHFATGVRTKKYECFHTAPCVAVQRTIIRAINGVLEILIEQEQNEYRKLSDQELMLYAANDGFNSLEQMVRWFFPEGLHAEDRAIVGQTIHFTNHKY